MTTDVSLVEILGTMLRIVPETSRGRVRMQIKIKVRSRGCMMNPTGRRVPDLSMRDDGGGKLVGERRWLPNYHNQDGVAP
jgi:hypothetical protein